MSDVVVNKNFVSADTTKIAEFETQSAEAVKEFNSIKEEFRRINSDLLTLYRGVGADAYKDEADNILEKIQDIAGTLSEISESMKCIRSTYSELDEQLAEYNRSLIQSQEEE